MGQNLQGFDPQPYVGSLGWGWGLGGLVAVGCFSTLASAIGRECGNESRDSIKGKQQLVNPSFPEHQQETGWVVFF